MRFTPPSVGTVARGNAPGGGKEAGRRAQRGGNRPRLQGGAGLFGPAGAGCAEALPPPSASSVPARGCGVTLASSYPRDGTFRVGLGSRCSPGPPGPPLLPGRTGRLRGRCRPWRALGPAPSRVAGVRGVGRGWEPAPLAFLTLLRRSPAEPTPLLLSSPVAALSCGTQPRVFPQPLFIRTPLTLCRLAFSFKSHCPFGSGQPFRSLARETPGGIWTCRVIFALRAF